MRKYHPCVCVPVHPPRACVAGVLLESSCLAFKPTPPRPSETARIVHLSGLFGLPQSFCYTFCSSGGGEKERNKLYIGNLNFDVILLAAPFSLSHPPLCVCYMVGLVTNDNIH